MSSDEVASQFDAMARRLGASGCTAEEIELLRLDHGVEFPWSYECFLTFMGKDAGGLFVGSDLAYYDVFGLRTAAQELLLENDSSFVLPTDAVVFAMHQGYQFGFMLCSDGPNPPVRWWTEASEPSDQATVVAKTLYEFLAEDEHQAGPSDPEESHRRSTQAFRTLSFVSERCPACGGELSWRGVLRYTAGSDNNNGRSELDATCGGCGRRFWRWADSPSDSLQPRQ